MGPFHAAVTARSDTGICASCAVAPGRGVSYRRDAAGIGAACFRLFGLPPSGGVRLGGGLRILRRSCRCTLSQLLCLLGRRRRGFVFGGRLRSGFSLRSGLLCRRGRRGLVCSPSSSSFLLSLSSFLLSLSSGLVGHSLVDFGLGLLGFGLGGLLIGLGLIGSDLSLSLSLSSCSSRSSVSAAAMPLGPAVNDQIGINPFLPSPPTPLVRSSTGTPLLRRSTGATTLPSRLRGRVRVRVRGRGRSRGWGRVRVGVSTTTLPSCRRVQSIRGCRGPRRGCSCTSASAGCGRGCRHVGRSRKRRVRGRGRVRVRGRGRGRSRGWGRVRVGVSTTTLPSCRRVQSIRGCRGPRRGCSGTSAGCGRHHFGRSRKRGCSGAYTLPSCRRVDDERGRRRLDDQDAQLMQAYTTFLAVSPSAARHWPLTARGLTSCLYEGLDRASAKDGMVNRHAPLEHLQRLILQGMGVPIVR